MLYQETQVKIGVFLVLLTFTEFLKVVVINIWIQASLKLGFFEMVFYDIIIPAHGITNKILTRNSNYVADAVI